jgi:AraC-like DNA-binding protein
MLLNILSLFIGFISICLGTFIWLNKQNKSKTKFYFIIILLLFGFIRFEFTLETLGIISNNLNPLKFRASPALVVIPVIFLFLSKLIKQKAPSVNDLYYFIPTVFVIILIEATTYINLEIYKYISIIYFTVYFFAISYQFQFYFYKKKFDYQTNKYLQSIKKMVLIFLLLLIIIIILVIMILFETGDRIQIMTNFYKYSSFIWLFVFYFFFENPIIIFGEQYLMQNIQISKKEDFLIWSLSAIKKIETKDLAVYKNCMDNITNIIFGIRKLEDNEAIVSREALKIDFLAKKTQIPKSHLEFVFKYHCHYSTNDYVNLIKIKYALSLIDSGYLNTMTINSLAEKTLFSARTTFFTNFKNFMGIPITTYINQTSIAPKKYQSYLKRE